MRGADEQSGPDTAKSRAREEGAGEVLAPCPCGGRVRTFAEALYSSVDCARCGASVHGVDVDARALWNQGVRGEVNGPRPAPPCGTARPFRPVQSATMALFRRYLRLLEAASEENLPPAAGCERSHLAWMARTALESGAQWPEDKLSRWLGFVQGVMAMQGLITVEQERETSRPLFHWAYRVQGLAVPATVAPGGSASLPPGAAGEEAGLPRPGLGPR